MCFPATHTTVNYGQFTYRRVCYFVFSVLYDCCLIVSTSQALEVRHRFGCILEWKTVDGDSNFLYI